MIYPEKLGTILAITVCLAAAARLGLAQTVCPDEPEATCPEVSDNATPPASIPATTDAPLERRRRSENIRFHCSYRLYKQSAPPRGPVQWRGTSASGGV